MLINLHYFSRQRTTHLKLQAKFPFECLGVTFFNECIFTGCAVCECQAVDAVVVEFQRVRKLVESSAMKVSLVRIAPLMAENVWTNAFRRHRFP